MEVKINGYKYEEKEAAILKRGLLVTEKALPKKVKDVTLYWQNYEEASLNEPVFYYMEFDKSFPKSFGRPETFFVTFPDEPKKGEPEYEIGEKTPKKK
tara:strand:- start:487 stop:780 length:294 start_codon:yes stop_codon:yes gene_type:complete